MTTAALNPLRKQGDVSKDSTAPTAVLPQGSTLAHCYISYCTPGPSPYAYKRKAQGTRTGGWPRGEDGTARAGLSLPSTRTLVTPYCKRTRPGRGTNTKAAGFPFTPVSLFPPSVLRLAPTHLGWDTRRQFTCRSRDPPPGSKRRQR
jgi:hypothetical protein